MYLTDFHKIVTDITQLSTKLRASMYRNYKMDEYFSIVVSCDGDFKLHVDVVSGDARVNDIDSIPTNVLERYLSVRKQLVAFSAGTDPYLPSQSE